MFSVAAFFLAFHPVFRPSQTRCPLGIFSVKQSDFLGHLIWFFFGEKGRHHLTAPTFPPPPGATYLGMVFGYLALFQKCEFDLSSSYTPHPVVFSFLWGVGLTRGYYPS